MNLTSKRWARMVAMCVGACAFSAVAEIEWVNDSFETPEGTVGKKGFEYKAEMWGGAEGYWLHTNSYWKTDSIDSDGSAIKAYETGEGYDNGQRERGSQYLNLETAGATLTRYVTLVDEGAPVDGGQPKVPDTVSFATEPTVWVDTLIKFTPSEDAPEIPNTDYKLAVYVNASSNLVVMHADVMNDAPLTSVFSGVDIDPEQWYRLTINLHIRPDVDPSYIFATIQLDGGSPLTHANGYNAETEDLGGPLFSCMNAVDMKLHSVAFQGTGAIDELVISDTEPTFGAPSSIMLTLEFANLSVTVDNVAVTSGTSLESGTEVAITAADFYQVDAISGAVFSGSAAPFKTSTGTLTAVASGTVTISAAMMDTFDMGGASGWEVTDVATFAAWATRYNLTEAQLAAAGATQWKDNYLLDISPSETPTLVITSIEYTEGVDDTTVTIMVEANAGANLADVDTKGGRLWIETSHDLVTWSEPSALEEEAWGEFGDVAKQATFTFKIAKGQFVKAFIK